MYGKSMKKISDLFGRRILLYLFRRRGSSWREWNMHKVIWSAGWRRRCGWRSQRCSFPPCWKGGANVFSAGSYCLPSAEYCMWRIVRLNAISNIYFLNVFQLFTNIKVHSFQKTCFRLWHLTHCKLFPISMLALALLHMTRHSLNRSNDISLSNSMMRYSHLRSWQQNS